MLCKVCKEAGKEAGNHAVYGQKNHNFFLLYNVHMHVKSRH